MSKSARKLILVTTTRADWGILSPLARELSLCPDVSLTIAAGNMHLSEKYGYTIEEIRAEGFDNVEELPGCEVDGSASSSTRLAADMAISTGVLIEKVGPDGIIILGDRYEMLGVATAALIAGIPIVHLHGGEISEGAIDDSVRHALTKMATMHLVATEKSGWRVVSMGEEPLRVVWTGAIGVENALSLCPMSRNELEKSLGGFKISDKTTLLVTYHPVTRHPDGLSVDDQIEALLGALDDVPEFNVIFTYPNNDTGSERIIERLQHYADINSERAILVKSLGKKRYLSALRYVRAVVGNTSSGLLEAPATPSATIDIGPRQQGRERAASVVHVEDNRSEIGRALRQLLGDSHHEPTHNPYYKENSVHTAVKAITELLPTLPLVKKFYSPKNGI